jgi:hypothetical protein
LLTFYLNIAPLYVVTIITIIINKVWSDCVHKDERITSKLSRARYLAGRDHCHQLLGVQANPHKHQSAAQNAEWQAS